jgi:hypothetical protein
LQKSQNKRENVMSTAYSTNFVGKFKTFFLKAAPFQCAYFMNWPKEVSYSAWKKLLTRQIRSIEKSQPHQRRNRSSSKREALRLKACWDKAARKQIIRIAHELKACESAGHPEDVKIELITMLKQFLERRRVYQHIEETIIDCRNKDQIIYSKQSIILSALAIFLFRMGSGNKFDDKSHDRDEKYSKTNISKFIDAPETQVPVIKTIEKFLKNLEEESVNDLMIAFFKDLQKSKFFVQHPQIMPGDFFLLAADCVHTHTYDHPHHVDKQGNQDCPCCLKRVYNKGTEKEKVKWQHFTLVFSFVFMGGLKIPIFRYPIHAKQIIDLENVSEDLHKQECETVALKIALPKIRASFPKMKIVLLLDGLYANRPVIRLAEEQRCGYIIVRKASSLPLLAKECDGISKESNHKKNCTKNCQERVEGWLIDQKYEWFNSCYLGEGISTNVLRFWENRTKEEYETKCYQCEWLFSRRISAKTCKFFGRQARSRWEEEDIFNSLKNRGFNFKHDYSRDPLSCFNWQGLALFAFTIFELFRFSEAVIQRVDLPQITLAEKLEGQLLHRPTQEIFSEEKLSKKMQFRYHFAVEFILFNKMDPENRVEKLLETG